ncbi:MAG: hypothetical protein C4520_05635 [Candidatus Abyssobacteria bacterium SURF_5]|uniref:Uncharacterized protein n=1 Tax=Abyssobacteria bacterium (strain SURF_5) TaxID=2093360 RepID=A0A3A4P7H2_ABYX5|nr:MAG: hypothetical protein C4520_05635 [Candidatus Abyssubacteria bacterium SURF_5]
MAGTFQLLPGGREHERPHESLSAERMLVHMRNVNKSVLQDALDTWGDMWDELQGNVTHGVLIRDESEEPIKPKCGWPQFLEKMWLLRHYVDYAKRLSEGKT